MDRRLFIEKIGVAGLAIPFFPSLIPGLEPFAETIRVGIIGAGHRGRQLAVLLAQVPGVRIPWLCDPDKGALTHTARLLQRGLNHDVALSTDPFRLLDQKDLAAVVVATPPPFLLALSRQACLAGKYVYTETPGDVATARLLQQAAQRYGPRLHAGWQRRAAPALVQAAAEVGRGLIGTLQQVTITHTYHPEVTGRETLHQMALQDLDLSGFLAHLPLFGEEELLPAAAAAGFNSFSARFRVAQVEVTWQGLARCGGAPQPPTRTIRLYGSKGVLQTAGGGLGYQVVNHAGRSLKQVSGDALPDLELTRLHLLGFLDKVRA